jgi:hypothetical protein
VVDERGTFEPNEPIGGEEKSSSSPDTQVSKSGTVTAMTSEPHQTPPPPTDRLTKDEAGELPPAVKGDLSTLDKTKEDEKVGGGGKVGNQGKKGKEEKNKESVGRRIMNKLPKWLSDSLVDVRTWKTFTRCMIATFGAMVLMLVQTCECGLRHFSTGYRLPGWSGSLWKGLGEGKGYRIAVPLGRVGGAY